MTAARRKTTAEQARGKRPQGKHRNQVSSNREEEEYCASGAGQEESADESAELSGAESEGLATEDEATTAGGTGR